MAYIDKINVNGTTYDLGCMNSLTDSSGHQRFVDGNLSTRTITNITHKYSKWSLSGSHFICVEAFNVAANHTQASYTVLCTFQVPLWLGQKIYPLVDNNDWVDIVSSIPADDESVPQSSKSCRCFLRKLNNTDYQIYTFDQISTDSSSLTYRVEFDLLIDLD